jgi:hypothetical protein
MKPAWAVCQDTPAAAATWLTATSQSPMKWPMVVRAGLETVALARTSGPDWRERLSVAGVVGTPEPRLVPGDL